MQHSTCIEVATNAFAYQDLWIQMGTNFYEIKKSYIQYAFFYRKDI